MANKTCPHCGKSNPSKLSTCRYCGMELSPENPAVIGNSHPVSATEGNPGSDQASPQERKEAQGPGGANENPSEPAWLKPILDENQGKGSDAKFPDKSLGKSPFSSSFRADETTSAIPADLLAGFEQLSTDEEQPPEWLGETAVVKPGLKVPPPVQGTEPPRIDAREKESLSTKDEASAPEWVRSMESTLQSVETSPADSNHQEKLPDWLKVSPDYGKKKKKPAKSEGETEPQGSTPERMIEAQKGATDTQAASHRNIEGIPGKEEGLPPHEIMEQVPSFQKGSDEPAPDWIDSIKNEVNTSVSQTDGASSEILPDWMAGFGPGPGTPTSSTGESVPDWLSDLESKPSAGAEKTSAFFNSDSLSAKLEAGEMPDWLADMQAEAAVHFDEGEKEKSEKDQNNNFPEDSQQVIAEKPGIGQPDQTQFPVVPEPGGEAGLSSGEQAFSIDMPDWLAKLKPESGNEGGSLPEAESGISEDTTPSSLPSWVQAMRPMESVISEVTDQNLDRTPTEVRQGPLVGLSGVLPVEPGLGQLKKPPAYSVKLQLSEAQQKYAAFLEQMVSEETRTRKMESRQGRSNRMLRWVISGLLLLTLGITLLSGARFTPAATVFSSDDDSARIVVNGIPSQSPVLVVFDYEAALSGEMAAVAAPLMDQLLQKGMRLAFISTSPIGPALAERFLHTTPLVNTNLYQAGVDYVNLGFLAGGLSGISAFAADPRKAAPVDTNGRPAWETGSLQGIQSLRDFSAVMVITDNGDSARSWVEQAGIQLGNTPLVMITSAQAGPLVRPYFDSGQVKGMVSGLIDAGIYEQEYNRPGLAAYSWSAYSLGLLVAEGMIGIGALVSLINNLQDRGKRRGEEA